MCLRRDLEAGEIDMLVKTGYKQSSFKYARVVDSGASVDKVCLWCHKMVNCVQVQKEVTEETEERASQRRVKDE
jgi:hypothetical protein